MEPLYTQAELEQVEAYQAPHYVAAALDLALWPVLLIVAARFLTRPLWALADRARGRVRSAVMTRVWGDDGWLPTLLFALGFFGFFALLSLPQEIWLGYVHEKAFGLSTQSASSFVVDQLKATLVLAASVSALALGLFGLARKTRHWWWMVALAASVVLVVSIALDPFKSKLYVDQHPLEAGPLRTRLTAMLGEARIPFGDIVVVETGEKSVRVQAAFAGSGPTRTILLTDTLLAAMSEDEILAAVAHEAGHVDEPKWPGRILTPLGVVALLLFIEWLFRRSVERQWFGITTRGDVRVLPLIVLTFDLAVMAVTPVTAALSRQREREADDFAVKLTKQPRALASLLTRVGRINRVDPNPPRWYVWSGVTHPTIPERVERALTQQP
ncbi:MAG: M48 family metalloprotease [Myxococcaceae bacterium]